MSSRKKRDEPTRPVPGRGKRRREDDDDDEGGSGGGKLLLLLGVGGVGVLLLLACLAPAAYYFFGRQPPVEEPPIAQGNPPDNPANPIDNAGPDKGNPDKSKKDPPKKKRPVEEPTPQATWRLAADPGPDLRAPPEKVGASATYEGLSSVIFPSTPSSFAAFQQNARGESRTQIVDLQKFKVVAEFPGFVVAESALSPDGKMLATPISGFGKKKTSLDVITADGRTLQSIPYEIKLGKKPWLDFGEEGHLVICNEGGSCQVFNIASGMEVKRFAFAGKADARHIAFSPSRKYLAIAGDRITIYRPLTGEKLGEVEMEASSLAFSPDGSQLTAFAKSRIVSWKLADGMAAVDHRMAKDVHSLVKGKTDHNSKSRVMEWLPDSSGWLLYGQVWIDYVSGVPVHTITYGDKDHTFHPRRLVGIGHVARIDGDRNPTLTIEALPSAQIAAAVTQARGAVGDPISGGGDLPDAKPGNLASANVLYPPVGNVAWSAVPDPAPALRAKLTSQSIPLRGRAQDVEAILFSSDVSHAVVIGDPNPLAKRKLLRADRYDLADGKHLGGFGLFAIDRPQLGIARPPVVIKAAASPDGSRVLVQDPDPKNSRRLDLWDLATGKHLVGLMCPAHVYAFAMIDANRVLTTGNGKLTLWKFPECQAVYVLEGSEGSLQLSPGRRYVAIGTKQAVCILEAATGQCKGQFVHPGGELGVFLAGAFSRDGKDFAASLGTGKEAADFGKGQRVARWSAGSGALLGMCDGDAGIKQMAFMGQHLMVGSKLYDWNAHHAIWDYSITGKGRHAPGTPDGRHWFATDSAAGSMLNVQTLPDPAAAALAAQLASGAALPVVTPGMPVQLQLNGGSALFTKRVQDALPKDLETRGYRIGPGGLTVTFSPQERATGFKIQYLLQEVGNPFGKTKDLRVDEKEVVCICTITDAGGAVLAKTDAKFGYPPQTSRVIFSGADYVGQLDQGMWNGAAEFAVKTRLPTNVMRVGGKLETLPKSSPLKGGG
jgi:WD40 repeat protein